MRNRSPLGLTADGLFPGVARSFLTVALFLLAGSTSAEAQSVVGKVLEEGDTVGIVGVDLSLLDPADSVVARVQSDSVGAFRLPAPRPGTYRIRAGRLGYATLQAPVEVGMDEAVEVELFMSTEAIPLEPIVVVGRREIRPGTLEQFYDRMARNKQAGKGQFLTIDQIRNRTQMSLALLLQTVPGVRSAGFRAESVQLLNPQGGSTFCTPEIFLDGRLMLGGFREITLHDLEGIEVYRGYEESVDGEFPNPCGQIFLWRKRDWGHPFSWSRVFGLVGVGALLLWLTTLF